MHVEEHDGRTVADTAALHAVTARRPETIRALCQRGERGYDLDACVEQLDGADDPVLLTVPEAHGYLGVPLGTLYARIHRGQLRAVGRREGREVYPLAALTGPPQSTGQPSASNRIAASPRTRGDGSSSSRSATGSPPNASPP